MRKTIYISCLLKDNMIISYKISGNLKSIPQDYYKEFYYEDKDITDEYKVKCMSVEFEETDITSDFNNYIFDEVARKFYKHWKIHPEHWGKAAYKEE